MTREGIAITVVASVSALLLCLLSFAVGESMGALPTEKDLKTCKTDLEASRKDALDSWNNEMKWASLVAKFADQQRVTVELVEQKFGITPEMIARAVAKDKAERADAGKP